MKRTIALIMSMILLACCFITAAGAETTITVDTDKTYPKPSSVKNNKTVKGQDPITGLKVGNEKYTPILVAMDNSENAFPHWGVGAASAIILVPNQSMGNCKILALFTSEYPHLAGGSRSARMTSLYFANVFNSAFSAAGAPEIPENDKSPVSVHYWRKKWGIKSRAASKKSERKWFDALGGGELYERTDLVPAPRNLLIHVDMIHKQLIKDKVPFEKRPFLFTDDPLSRGDAATTVSMDFSNSASNCTFYYQEDKGGYVRESLMGADPKLQYNYDRLTEEVLTFSNVIVIRANFQFDSSSGTSYPYIKNHFAGSGQADIFQNGHYIKGSWYRKDVQSRLIILDENGKELKFQRGKTFFVLNNEKLVVSYE